MVGRVCCPGDTSVLKVSTGLMSIYICCRYGNWWSELQVPNVALRSQVSCPHGNEWWRVAIVSMLLVPPCGLDCVVMHGPYAMHTNESGSRFRPTCLQLLCHFSQHCVLQLATLDSPLSASSGSTLLIALARSTCQQAVCSVSKISAGLVASIF